MTFLSDEIGGLTVEDTDVYDSGPARALLDRHRRICYPYRCRFGQAELEIYKDVFCPAFTQTSSLLLRSTKFGPGQRVLDVFSGSGGLAINAALLGARVVAVDVSASAVACARRNASLNAVSESIDVRWGTMQDTVRSDETFDVIVANPPLLPGAQPDLLSMAIFDPGLQCTIDFLRTIKQHLRDNAVCYLLTSDVTDRLGISLDYECLASGLDASLVEKLDVGYESYRVHEIRQRH